MDQDEGKLFIGGISWETTEEKLREHFSQYGEVTHTIIMRDKITNRPRGFGFVVFADHSLLDRVLQEKHTIDGRTVEAKRALSRVEQQTSGRSANSNPGKQSGGGADANMRTKKIFVGGLPPTLSEDGFRDYFMQYGAVEDVVVMYDQQTQRPRGFGFITFDSEDAVDCVLHKTFHELNGKLVEVKRALPKDATPGSGSRSGGGNYQSHGVSGAYNSLYDNKMDANRYMQPQSAAAGFPGYGSAGFGAPTYGYGPGNSGVGYGGYGSGGYNGGAGGYNAHTGGYGNPNASSGYISGPAGGYGNPNAPGGSYMNGAAGGYGNPNVPRGPWNSQAPGPYGTTPYAGNNPYGQVSWNSPAGGGSGSGGMGGAAYGSQGYGYGGYGGTEGAYGSHGGYGAAGARTGAGPAGNPPTGTGDQGVGQAYNGGGYGEVSGKTGYSAGWGSDTMQGAYATSQGTGPVSYGAAYCSGPVRQTQQP